MAERIEAASAVDPEDSGAVTGTDRKSTGGKATASKTTASKTTASKTTKSAATKTNATTKGGGTSMAKPADTKTSGARGGTKSATKSATKGTSTAAAKSQDKPDKTKLRSAEEIEEIRAALQTRREELREEYDQHLAEIAELQRGRLTDSAGDDQADTGSKTFEREQEISLANSILERTKQVERALERLDEGSYGWCERCGAAIPVERLAAFPSATLCVRCKELEERR